jgi:outer membrane protein assembly factor BamB
MKAFVKLLIGAVIAATVVTGAARVGSAAGPLLVLKPASGPPTGKLAVKGTGFGVHEPVDLYFDTTDMVLAATGATGTFSVSFRVPAGAQPGKHYVTGVGRTTGLSAQRAFTVRTNWAEYGFNGAHLGQNPYENTLSAANVAQLQQAWSFPTSVAIHGSPTVANGVVYTAGDLQNLYALNAATGKQKWFVSTGGAITSSAAISGSSVYFGSEDGNVYAVNASTGASTWTDSLSSLEPSGFDSSPAVAGGSVYIGGNSGNVYSLSAADGFSQWVFITGGPVVSSPAVVGGVVYVDSQDGNLYALNAATGTELWSFATGSAIISSPTVANGTVYVGTYFGHTLYAVNAASGAERWSFDTVGSAWSPAVAGGVVYVGGGSSYYLYALSASAGVELWQAAMCGGVIAEPTVANGVVYEDCGAIDPSTGADTLQALRAFDGSLLWTASNGAEAQTSPAVVNGWVYLGSTDGSLYAYALPVPPAQATTPAASALRPDLTLRIA